MHAASMMMIDDPPLCTYYYLFYQGFYMSVGGRNLGYSCLCSEHSFYSYNSIIGTAGHDLSTQQKKNIMHAAGRVKQYGTST